MSWPAKSGALSRGLILAIWLGSSVSVSAACYPPDQQLPAQTVSEFTANPGQFLQNAKYADGGAEMIALVRDLVASNPATLPLVVGLIDNGNGAQQTAIGTGLGQAASLCIRPDPTFAADIQSQLANSTSDKAKSAYAAVTGNLPIRSVAGGGGVSGGSSGGSTGSIGVAGGTSSFTPFASSFSTNPTTNYFTASASSSSSTASNSVSP